MGPRQRALTDASCPYRSACVILLAMQRRKSVGDLPPRIPVSPEARIELALKLGRELLDTLSKAHGISVDEARKMWRKQRQDGRLHSNLMRVADP